VNSARLRVLQEVFPDAVFIVVRRERSATVQSILNARKTLGVCDDRWWSLKPKGYEDFLGSRPERMAEAQFDYTYKMIDDDLKARRIDLTYESICNRPHEELKRVDRAMRDFGIALEQRQWQEIPKIFDER
jgi:hypothetical protein